MPIWRGGTPQNLHRKRGCDGRELQSLKNNSQSDAERAWLRRVLKNGLEVGSFEALPYLRPCRLLRQFSPPSCDKALSRNEAPDHRRLRSTGRLGMVLRRRSHARPVRSNDTSQRAHPTLFLIRLDLDPRGERKPFA